jgi:putative ATPase
MLREALGAGELPSILFWGPPGSGKTTIARLLAQHIDAAFVNFSAVLSGVKEVRQIVEEARLRQRSSGKKTVLFVDEIHRFNKGQQDSFLPHIENGTLILLGATTENPSFEVNSALLSRCRVVTLEPLAPRDVETLIRRAMNDKPRGLGKRGINVTPKAIDHLARQARGDARIALNALEIAAAGELPKVDGKPTITLEVAEKAIQAKALLYDKAGEQHYNVISAFIKSLRASDPDAAVYWLARMVEAGEDPLFIARRMVILASEDVGNADPRALPLATAAMQAVHMVGMPEARIILSHAATYLACAPKSNASYMALERALQDVRDKGALDVPKHLRNAPTKLMKDLGYSDGYRYDHDFEHHFSGQPCLPKELEERRYYEPSDQGVEDRIRQRLDWLREHREKYKK